MRSRSKAPRLYSRLLLSELIILICMIVILVMINRESRVEATEVSGTDSLLNAISIELPDSTDYSVDFLIGKTDHPDFIMVRDPRYVFTDMPVHRLVFDAFKRMQAAASRDSINLKIVSAARSWTKQRSIWEARMQGHGYRGNLSREQKIVIIRRSLRYNSMPGISRHHWGTELDLCSVDPAYFETARGRKIFRWLSEHAGDYGFVQAYTAPEIDSSRTGFFSEPWHWSYAPLSKPILTQYLQKVNYTHLKGFSGDDLAEAVNVIQEYVGGVNPALK